jgi:hypothetical protein
MAAESGGDIPAGPFGRQGGNRIGGGCRWRYTPPAKSSYEFANEEGVTARPGPHEVHYLIVEIRVQVLRHHVPHRLRTERLRSKEYRVALTRQGLQSAGTHRWLPATPRQHHDQRQPTGPVPEKAQEVERWAIAPVNIIDGDDEASVRG